MEFKKDFDWECKILNLKETKEEYKCVRMISVWNSWNE
jgi:hypothetical protein